MTVAVVSSRASSCLVRSDSHTQFSTLPYRDSYLSEYTSFSANVRYLNWFDEQPHILNIHTTVYLNALLATLNSRQSLNDQRQNDPMFSLPLSANARRSGKASQHTGSKSTIRGQVDQLQFQPLYMLILSRISRFKWILR